MDSGGRCGSRRGELQFFRADDGSEGHRGMPLVGLPYTPRHPLRYELHGRNDHQATRQGVPDRS